jgi:DNA adenine methylase
VKEVQMSDLRPPLKWAGGKRWLVPHLLPVWEKNASRRLVEPFAGGLAVALGLLPRRALLNDVNPHTINFYRWVKQGLKVEVPLVNKPDAYYQARTRFNTLIQGGRTDSREAAELFYYLNRTCYNGLCRFNSEGGFNTPMGRYKTINYAKDFLEYAESMREWEFTVGDFERMRVDPRDFVYADPPYDRSFNQYSQDSFSWADQVRLAAWLSRLKGPVVVSNFASSRVVRLYRKLGFSLKFYDAPRMINCTGDRTPAREVLATRNL